MRYSNGYPPQPRVGVLLVNLGTPDAPTAPAVRRYLREFLSDPRVVEISPLLWRLLLNGVILPLRGGRSAQAYRRIWSQEGSPLLVQTLRLAECLQARLASSGEVDVVAAMCYGRPSIVAGLARLRERQVARVVVLPLYPQYAASTTGAVFDAVARELRCWRYVPGLAFVNGYAAEPVYIEAVAQKVAAFRAAHGDSGHLLLSFHGLPAYTQVKGDPYYRQCCDTAQRIAVVLDLPAERWQLVFQSRFGRAEWLRPYCTEVLAELPGRGIRAVDVVCPGFAVDCLETLDEIADENRRLFLAAGGGRLQYVPALNADPAHVALLAQLVARAAWLAQ